MFASRSGLTEHGWEISRTSKTWRNMPPDLANPLNLLEKLPTSTRKLSLRKSMLKYESSNTKLGVLSWSKYQQCYLNLQIITLLSMLGISDEVFDRGWLLASWTICSPIRTRRRSFWSFLNQV
nr:probable RNA-dependent RNA polymerase 1 [Ipomoea batatas]